MSSSLDIKILSNRCYKKLLKTDIGGGGAFFKFSKHFQNGTAIDYTITYCDKLYSSIEAEIRVKPKCYLEG